MLYISIKPLPSKPAPTKTPGLDRRSEEVKITEEVVKAAAGNKGSGKESPQVRG
jgi:hypothetical protein